MKRLVHLLLFAAWIVGAVTGGLTVQPEAPITEANRRVAVETGWGRLAVRVDQIVMTVGHGENRWRAAVPIPSFVHDWLREKTDLAGEAPRTSPCERAPFIPL